MKRRVAIVMPGLGPILGLVVVSAAFATTASGGEAAPVPPASSISSRAAETKSAATGLVSAITVLAEAPANPDSLHRDDGRARGSTPARRRFTFSPQRHERTASFLILEASGSRLTVTEQDGSDEYLVTNSIGLMRNLDSRWSVGGALELHWAYGIVEAAPAVRLRRWFGRQQSVEASVGWLISPGATASDFRDTQLVGPIASVKYAPIPQIFVQGGVCRLRDQNYVYDPPSGSFQRLRREHTEAFGGIGFSGGGGAILWGLELAALGVLLVYASQMGS